MKRVRILYLMHTPWGWIKQRPHFLAEGLFLENDVTVVFKKEYVSRTLTNNELTVPHVELFRLPFERFWIIRLISSLLIKLQIVLIINSYDVIWLTHPMLLSWVPRKFTRKCMIYDCMDDALEFKMTEDKRIKLKTKEEFIYNNSSLVFSSSEYLKQKLISRYGYRDITVVNNALNKVSSELSSHISKEEIYNNCSFKIIYIGTISSWFDFKLIDLLLKEYNNIELYLYGPTEVVIPMHNRIHYKGPIEHNLVYSVMAQANLLIMPFIVNELIRSVNPVKLYEYISSGVPSLAPRYNESEKFEDYVFLYSTHEECIKIVYKIMKGELQNKRDICDCIQFAKSNTWNNRVDVINKCINKVINE